MNIHFRSSTQTSWIGVLPWQRLQSRAPGSGAQRRAKKPARRSEQFCSCSFLLFELLDDYEHAQICGYPPGHP
eukprot:8015762-Pyramimonas_sp.AAC.1